jgi:hypothetical protein
LDIFPNGTPQDIEDREIKNMTFKDPEVSKAYHREYKRNARSQGAPSSVTRTTPVEWRAACAEDLRIILESQLSELMNSDIDVAVKSRAVAALLSIGVRLIESASLEARIEELEGAINPIKPKDVPRKVTSDV